MIAGPVGRPVNLPDFLVIGTPKAGSTALHSALAGHPQLFMTRVKEPKFFLCDGPPPAQGGPGDRHSYREWIWRRSDYEALFQPAPPGSLRGESTPLYLGDFTAHERIRRVVPEAKLIAILRHPVDRAYSNWTHLWSDGLEPIGDFLTACGAEDARLAAGWAPFWGYRRLGRYGEQLEHLYSLFPPEQIHLLRYRDLLEEPAAALDRVCTFLGVEPGVVTDVPRANVSTFVPESSRTRPLQRLLRGGAGVGARFPPRLWRVLSGPLLYVFKQRGVVPPELTREDRLRLLDYFAADIARLEQVTGESYSDWLEPEQPAERLPISVPRAAAS